MKLNWGHSILIFFICYVSFLVFTVIKSRGVDHSLVEENYYDHDIAYQKRYQEVKNRAFLHKDLSIVHSQKDKALVLDFGIESGKLTGLFTFYRPSNSNQDRTEDLRVENGKQAISTEAMEPGKWIIKVKWTDALRDYYKEEEVYISHT